MRATSDNHERPARNVLRSYRTRAGFNGLFESGGRVFSANAEHQEGPIAVPRPSRCQLRATPQEARLERNLLLLFNLVVAWPPEFLLGFDIVAFVSFASSTRRE